MKKYFYFNKYQEMQSNGMLFNRYLLVQIVGEHVTLCVRPSVSRYYYR